MIWFLTNSNQTLEQTLFDLSTIKRELNVILLINTIIIQSEYRVYCSSIDTYHNINV